MAQPRDRAGAYGLAITGLEGAPRRLSRAPADWRRLHVEQSRPSAGDRQRRTAIGEDGAFIRFDRHHAVLVDRGRRRAIVLAPSDREAELLAHPLLILPAVAFSAWEGRAALHGGAFLADGRAWGLFGSHRAGKSTALAALALAGTPVLADDLVVIADGRVLAGPRYVDLRPSAARHFELPPDVASVRQRRRLTPAPAPAQAPIGGWIFLSWGKQVQLRRLDRSEILARLADAYALTPLFQPTALQLLELASHPAFELRRPRSFAAIGEAIELLTSLRVPVGEPLAA